MGFDLSGLNPQQNTPVPEAIKKWQDDDGWPKYDEMESVKGATDEYFKARKKWNDENPGQYFRANIHWWFPLWEFVSTMCIGILTEEDIDGCCYNAAYEITEDKAIKIAEKLETLNDSGEIKQYENALRENAKSFDNPDGNCAFSVDVVMSFAKFCKESGGFTVC
tara:strand:+ start:33 stop:527 length:495 start_codon:yes stop_codon:yes gene_type:complete